ncbi:transcriptional regulator of nitric oxide reductase [Rhodobacter viridis]|uniref:Transcriptional regulator of nitric oxide reductase n=1 Tax=Rhodobacter viridis TaxID=1054202 RepID=A0A318U4G1_9RHOB|nr:4Fe-4S binding protein [Rhodobacter viridis]PYF12919.1 transcriptional regulator of nitric oxide reductase [Rhodobacter viridis]
MIRFLLIWLAFATPLCAEVLTRDQLSAMILAPYELGQPVNDKGVWTLLNSGGGEAGFVFETAPLAPLPGFSGAPIDLLVLLDREGRFIDVRLLHQNEPIFVSGLGEAPFRAFLEQYRGHSINEPLVVGTPYGSGGTASDNVYLDGVTKATASVRIAHDSILAATLAVAREKMQGVGAGPAPKPDPAHDEALDWKALLDQGLVGRLQVSEAQLDAAFKGTTWAHDGAGADPEAPFIDLYAIDLGPPSLARAVLAPETLAEIARFTARAPDDELFLLIEAGQHGLVSEDFVRNTAPDRLTAVQDGLPLVLRDADILPELAADLPPELSDATKMVVRLDRRLGFDPTRPWELRLQAVRQHGMFQAEVGSAHFPVALQTPERFFLRPAAPERLSPFAEALRNRATDLWALAGFLALLIAALLTQSRLAGLRAFTPVRLTILALVIGFVGFWGQGQLSIVTVMAVARGLVAGGLEVLLYDPFGLAVWAAAGLGFLLWGRGFFCGWLCPFGAMQEFAHHAGRLLRLPRIEPPRSLARALLWTGPIAATGLIAVAFLAPEHAEAAAELEPFKTAITMHFDRPWPYLIWAIGWLAVSTVWFKGFCRSVCPLGAVMRLGGLLRLRAFIPRRVECGKPCQLCKVRCAYGAIKPTGEIRYSECFQCLDCVAIHDDKSRCVPLVLAAKRARRVA